MHYYRHNFAPAEPRFSPREINGLLPVDHRVVYDVHEIIARLVDNSLFWELLPHTGEEMVTGIARINGLYVGIIANNQQLTPHPELKDPHPGRRAALSRGDRQDFPVLPVLQFGRDSDHLAAGHLGFRHRHRG